MIQKIESQDITSILEELFVSLVDNENIDDVGKFNIEYNSQEDVGKWIAGRNDSDNGLDYVYRIRYNNTSTEPDKIYLYSNEFGWANMGVLLGEQEIILGLCEWVDRYVDSITVDYTPKIQKTFNSIEESQREIRQSYELDDIVNAINMYNFEFLQNTISTEGDDTVEFWKLLYSYDKQGEVIENKITIPYQDETLFFARSERQYTENNSTKNYAMGLVIGIDDTPDSFFVHRIERDDCLDNPEFDWDLNNIRNKMGFDIDYTDLENNIIPINRRTRLQGNLCVIPYNFDSERLDYYNQVISELKQILYRVYDKVYFDAIGKDNMFMNDYNLDLSKYIYKSHLGKLEFYNKPSTKNVIKIQNKIGVSEDDVRKEQENRNIKRLSSNLRCKIVSDLHLEEFCDWFFTNCSVDDREKYYNNTSIGYGSLKIPNRQTVISELVCTHIGDEFYDKITTFDKKITRSTIHKLADKESTLVFNPKNQTNMILGNHSVMASPAQIHPDDNAVNLLDNRALEKLIVPNKGLVICGHDEHKSRIYTFPKGVYEFRFLEGLNTDLF